MWVEAIGNTTVFVIFVVVALSHVVYAGVTGWRLFRYPVWAGPGAGARPATDYDTKACTNGHCDRRAQYLEAATDLLLEDLEFITAQWGADGAARKAVMADDGRAGLAALFKAAGRDPKKATAMDLGFILGPMMEEFLRRALLLSMGDPMTLVTSPLSAVLLGLAAILLVIVLLPAFGKTREVAFKED